MAKLTWWFDHKDDNTLIVGRNDDEPVEIPTTRGYIKDLETSRPAEQQRMLKAQYDIHTSK